MKFEAEFLRKQFFNSYLVRIEPYEGWDKWDDHITEVDLDDYKKFDLKITPEFGKLEIEAKFIMKEIKKVFMPG